MSDSIVIIFAARTRIGAMRDEFGCGPIARARWTFAAPTLAGNEITSSSRRLHV